MKNIKNKPARLSSHHLTFEKQKQVDLWVPGQPGLLSESTSLTCVGRYIIHYGSLFWCWMMKTPCTSEHFIQSRSKFESRSISYISMLAMFFSQYLLRNVYVNMKTRAILCRIHKILFGSVSERLFIVCFKGFTLQKSPKPVSISYHEYLLLIKVFHTKVHVWWQTSKPEHGWQ